MVNQIAGDRAAPDRQQRIPRLPSAAAAYLPSMTSVALISTAT
jgi:hypothetical protein